MTTHRPKKIGDLLGRILARHGLSEMTAQMELESAWRRVAGDSLKKRTRVGSLRRGVLEILVDNAALLHELESFRKEELLEQLRDNVTHHRVQSLRFRRS
ncbi:hypothetical protein Pan216_00030 [Planctomycetes bacterium Pan216]|uniref:DUF721 domain-containing protein n=1 Tax=Kolteria novifilia TaxID=2527975 RepID=A0A518AWU0_9BACT|nr:hypothetical protein Pan216_00030 [Planctomycetes bacterium Pan216]